MSEISTEKTIETKAQPGLLRFSKRLAKEKPLGVLGGVITLILLLTGIFAHLLIPYGINETKPTDRLLAPSATYWLGTDNLGRDVFSRVIYGARISVIIGLTASTLATILSLIIGMLSGYIGGKFDLTIQRVVDAWMCIPPLILMMVIISIIGPGMWQVIITLGLMWGIIGSRIIRSAVIGIKENVYAQAAKAIGCPPLRILSRHILPNIMAPAIILFTTRVPNVILAEASLSFLGFGIPAPTPSWGGMLSGSGRTYMLEAPWMALWPGLALAIVVYGVNMFGDAVRDILDPRLRGGSGSFGAGTKAERKKGGGDTEHDDNRERPVDVRERPVKL
jgi:peptide/nickel transport system permease protein